MKTLHTPAIERLLTEALAIEAEAAQEVGAVGFMARTMVQATLPHRKVPGNEFTRTNGVYSLSIMAPAMIGLPYGTVPRLLLAWLTTEAVRTQHRELELGDTLSHFMGELGMVPTGGEWGSITRLKNQTRRLYASSVTATYEDGQKSALIQRTLVDSATFWWDPQAPDQAGLWKSTVTLSEPFFREVIDRPVPIDLRAIRALKKSPLALDIYSWLTYRASYAERPSLMRWESLALQFGSNYSHVRFFKAAFLAELRKVLAIYTDARVEEAAGGLLVKPAFPHIAKKR